MLDFVDAGLLAGASLCYFQEKSFFWKGFSVYLGVAALGHLSKAMSWI
jgi:hypothetical protein